MKNNLLSLAAIAMALASFLACQKEQAFKGAELTTVNFTASMDSETKASFGEKADGKYPVLWSDDEQIFISLDGASAVQATNLLLSSDRKTISFQATFADVADAASHTIAAWCANAGAAVPETQAPIEGSVDPAAIVLSSSATITDMNARISLCFEHQSAYGKMNVKGMPEGVKVKKAVLKSSGVGFVGTDNAGKTLTIQPASELSANAVFFASAAVNFKGSTVDYEITGSNDKIYEASVAYGSDATLYFVKGNCSSFSVNVKEKEAAKLPTPANLTLYRVDFSDVIYGWDKVPADADYAQYVKLVTGKTDIAQYQVFEFHVIDKASGKDMCNGITEHGAVNNGTTNSWFKYPARILIGRLNPQTEYTFMVRLLSNNTEVYQHSDWATADFTTTEKKYDDPANAIFVEHFDKFVFAGDCFLFAQGPDVIFDESTTLETPYGRCQTPASTTSGYFDYTDPPKQLVSEALPSWEGCAVYGYYGYPKLGTGSVKGWIKTPELSAITGTQDIKVSFKARTFVASFNSDVVSPAWKTKDATKLTVTAEGAGTCNCETDGIDLSEVTDKWETYTVNISAATNQTRVKIAVTSGLRFFLDDIVITPAE